MYEICEFFMQCSNATLLFSCFGIVSAISNDNGANNEHKDPGWNTHINLLPALRQLGYNDYAQASEDLIYQLLQIPTPLINNPDGSFTATPILNDSQIINLTELIANLGKIDPTSIAISAKSEQENFSKNISFSLDNIKKMNSTVIQNSTESKSPSTNIATLDAVGSKTGLRACLIIAISDYPGSQYDLTNYWGPQIIDCLETNATGYEM
jgi:hypothetical protein